MKRLVLSLFAAFSLGLLASPQLSTGAFADEVVYRGSFKSESGHTTSGDVSIVKTSSGYQVVLENNFSLDGAPDPWVAFGSGGVKNSGLVAILQHNSNRQVYTVPAGIDPTQFTTVYIWCKRFGVPIGSAKLKS